MVWYLVAMSLALGSVALTVGATGDGSVLVPAPEATTTSLLRQLHARRPSNALAYLDRELSRQMGSKDLENFWLSLERRYGRIQQVNLGQGTIAGDHAFATAIVETDRAEIPLQFELIREMHLWRISKLPRVE